MRLSHSTSKSNAGQHPPPDEQALRQRGADVLLGEAGDQLADGQTVPSAQSVQQRHRMELHHPTNMLGAQPQGPA